MRKEVEANIKKSRKFSIIDLKWGDTGKGRVTDWFIALAARLGNPIRFCVRPTGSHNAGHRVVNHFGEFKLNAVPSGICFDEIVNICGAGMALHPVWLMKEIRNLQEQGVRCGNLLISDRTPMILPWYKIDETLQEIAKGTQRVGTTGNAVGSTYARHRLRTALQMGILQSPSAFRVALHHIAFVEEAMLKGLATALRERFPEHTEEIEKIEFPHPDAVWHEYLDASEFLVPRIIDVETLLQDAADRGDTILHEGAQGPGLDITLGPYPFVTSSNTGTAGHAAATGIFPEFVIGVTKAYDTRVGNGPFISELEEGDLAHKIRERGGEYGTVTGRPRRIGWRDLVFERRALKTNEVDTVVVTKVDVLNGLPTIAACSHYQKDGGAYKGIPSQFVDGVKPGLIYYEGYENPAHPSGYRDLDVRCRYFLEACDRIAGGKTCAVSTGAELEEILLVE